MRSRKAVADQAHYNERASEAFERAQDGIAQALDAHSQRIAELEEDLKRAKQILAGALGVSFE